jgi:rare lipoprotein A
MPALDMPFRAFWTSLLLVGLLLGLTLSLILSLGLSPAQAADPVVSVTPPEWNVPDGKFFTAANSFPVGLSPKGFTVTNQSGVPLWSEIQRMGGVTAIGYPISRRFQLGGFTCQTVQKGILQWHPETKTAMMVNVFDLLSELGKDDWLLSTRSVPKPLPKDFDQNKNWTQIVQARTALLDAYPAIKKRYTSVADPMTVFGLPTSQVTDMGNHYAVRLQRAVIQQWKVDVAWAKAGETTVANGGDVAKEAGLLPAKSDRPEDPPAGVWKVEAGKLKFDANCTWYGDKFQGRSMANGEVFDMNNPTIAASNMYPFGTKLKVTSKATGKSVQVTVKDTGLFQWPIATDLSYAAFAAIDDPKRGTVPVVIEVVP